MQKGTIPLRPSSRVVVIRKSVGILVSRNMIKEISQVTVLTIAGRAGAGSNLQRCHCQLSK
jgi:hypothetical protein